MRLDDSPTGWKRYLEQLVLLAANPGDDQQQDHADISSGRPIGTDAWKRALARAHRHRALEQDLPEEETLPLNEARWDAALTDALDRLGLTLDDIGPTPRMPPWKIEVASILRQTSGAPYRWIAKKLCLGPTGSIRSAVCRSARMQP